MRLLVLLAALLFSCPLHAQNAVDAYTEACTSADASDAYSGACSGTPPAYVGPGDVVGVTWQIWGSCAFVYNATAATTATSLCDLNAVTSGTAVCTLRGTSTGAVDLSAYCPGSLTPMAACAAASGGSCVVSRLYDAVLSNHWTQATNSSRPGVTFSGISSKPTIVFSGSTSLASGNITLGSAYSVALIMQQGSGINPTSPNLWSHYAGTETIGWNNGASGPDNINLAAAIVVAAASGTPHKVQGVFNGASSDLNVDGTSNSGSASAFNQPATVSFNDNGSGQDRLLGEAGATTLTVYSPGLNSNFLARWGF